MRWASWIRNGKCSLERRWALYQTLRRKVVARRSAARPRLEVLEDRWLLSTYTVTSTADDGSAGTLRDAINQANMAGSTITEIDFKIGTSGSAQTLSLKSQLPELVASGVFINGLSQGGSSNTKRLITLDGTKAGSGSNGLPLGGSGCIVSGLIIQHFNNGILVDGFANTIGGYTAGAGNVISGNSSDGILIGNGIFGTRMQGNYIGTDPTGSKAEANNIGIEVAGPNSTIGGPVTGAGNVISGNTKDGILIEGTATGVIVQGDYIGTNAAGTSAVGNGVGVEIKVSGQVLGSTSSAARNLISGNGDGVLIDSGVSGVLVLGNYIGTDVTGSKKVANNIGILDRGSYTTIGGTTAAAGNLIAGNTADGVDLDGTVRALVQGNSIGTWIATSGALGNSIGILANGSTSTIGGTTTAARNLISGNSHVGIYVGAAGVLVEGNYIGTDPTGTIAYPNSIGIETAATNVTIGGTIAGARNVISGNKADGVLITTSSGVQVLGNYIGTKPTGANNLPNSIGVEIDASGEVFGSTSSAARNIISGNFEGVLIDSSISGVQVLGCYIGTDITGTIAVANGGGVEVAGFNDTIGGTATGASNLISGNYGDGVLIDSGGSGVQVQGNYIGTNAAGSNTLQDGNTNSNGIEVAGSNNTVGGTAAGAANIISGNFRGGVLIDDGASGTQVQGNYIGTDVTGANSLGNNSNGVEIAGSNNTIGGTSTAARNLISASFSNGISIDSTASGVQVEGNFIGTDVTGTKALGFSNSSGIEMAGSNITIGGTTPGAGNLISGNNQGVAIDQSASGVRIEGNYIGTDVTGTKAIANRGGISIEGTNITVGGTSAAARNIISGNTGSGVSTATPNGPGEFVEGNYIGTDVTGTKAVPNSVGIQAAGPVTIGGTASGAGNLISGNSVDGVYVFVNSGVHVQGNYIGTDVTGAKALANSIGVEVNGPDSTIGGTVTGAGNVISGNSADGVRIDAGSAQFPTQGVQVQGNYIGTDITGTHAIPNSLGIEVDGSNDTIGGSVAGAGNLIAHNSQGGVLVNAGTADTISRNSITANGGAGTGPGITLSNNGNNNLAAPNLTAAHLNGSTLTVTGSFTPPTANNAYVLEFFANPASDAEGRVFLGSLGEISTNTTSQAFAFTTTTTVTGTYPLITATLTDGSGDTSPFSNGVTVNTAPFAPIVITNPSDQTVPEGQNATFTAAANGNPTPAVQWQVSTDGGKTFTTISGATSTTLTLKNITNSMNGNEYHAVFTNSIGSATTSAATLTVTAAVAPSITGNPSNQTVTAGQSATFTASASGSPTPTVQWQVSTDGGKSFSNITGATSTTLTLTNVSFALNGHEYRAVFTNSAGSATTTAAVLTVQTAPAFTSGNSATFTVGQGGSFTVTTVGSPTPTLTVSGVLPSGVTFTNNGNGTAGLHGIPAPGTSGTYYFTIRAHNGIGSDALQNFVLVVSPSAPKVPPLLAFLAQLLGAIESVNAHGTAITGYFFGIPLLAATFDDSGNLQDATLLGFDITFLVDLLR